MMFIYEEVQVICFDSNATDAIFFSYHMRRLICDTCAHDCFVPLLVMLDLITWLRGWLSGFFTAKVLFFLYGL